MSGTEDPELFGAERFGHFSYAIPVDRRGRYTVVLHFAEFYHGPQLPGGGGTGQQGLPRVRQWADAAAGLRHLQGSGQPAGRDQDFPNIEPSAQGKINLMFEPVVNNATVSGIEILDESK